MEMLYAFVVFGLKALVFIIPICGYVATHPIMSRESGKVIIKRGQLKIVPFDEVIQ